MTVTLRTAHGTYLTADDLGQVQANRTAAGPWEQFRFEPDPSTSPAGTHGWIWTAHNTLLTAEESGGGRVSANRTVKGPWERWGVWQRNGVWSLQAPNRMWVRVGHADEDYAVAATRQGEPGPWEDFQVERVSGAHPNPLRGYLASTPRGWTHDSGRPCAPHGLMCGDGLLAKSEGKDIRNGILRPAAAAGYQFTMPWSPLIWRRGQGGRFWGDRTFSPLSVPNAWDHIREWVQWSKELELKVFLAHGGVAGATNAEEDEYVRGLIALMEQEGPEHFIFPMMGNEVRDTGDRDDLDPRELARIIRPIHDRFPDVPYLIGSWTGDPLPEDVRRLTDALRAFAPESRHAAFHGHRHGDWTQKVRRLWNYPFETYRDIADCYVNDESAGPQGRNGHLSEMHHADEVDQHVMCGILGISVLARTLINFTCSPSVIFDEPFEDIPGFFEAPAFAREIPVDAVTYRHAIHSGGTSADSRRHRIFRAQGDIRIDGRVSDDGEFAFLAYGRDVEHVGSALELDKPAEFELVTTDRDVHHFRLSVNQRIPSVPVNKLFLLRGRQS